jgi:hypothetical protein
MREHPRSSNPNAIFLCGLEKSLGKVINTSSLTRIYADYKKTDFPKLLKDPDVPDTDKERLRILLTKPWNPYVIRHSALTYKAKILRESALRQHAGWNKDSEMVEKYIHFFNPESSNELLQEAGLLPKDKEINPLKPKYCSNCKEANKPNSKFCSGCQIVLTYDAYSEVAVEARVKEAEDITIEALDRNEELEKKLKELRERNRWEKKT